MGKLTTWITEKVIDPVVEAGQPLVGGLTDTTGDIVQAGEAFTNDAAADFNKYVSDPVREAYEDAGNFKNEIITEAKGDLVWVAEKTAEGYVQNTDFLFGEGGWFESVTEKVQQGWDSAEDGNVWDAAKYTGQAFLDAVDEVATGGLGELGYNWIMNSTNDMESTGEARYEIRGNLIKVSYQGQDMIFKAEDEAGMADFVGQLAALAEGESDNASDWPTIAAAVENFTSDEASRAYTEGSGMTAGKGEKDYSNIAPATKSDGSAYIIGGL